MSGQGEITCTPDPPSRGTTVVINLTGGTPGASTVTISDGTLSYDMPVALDETGAGTVQFGIPENWGAGLNVSCPGFADLNTAVS